MVGFTDFITGYLCVVNSPSAAKEVNALTMPETLVSTRFMLIQLKVFLCLGLKPFLPRFLSKSR